MHAFTFTHTCTCILAVLIPAFVQAQPLLQPCGTITKSTRLQRDCEGPLVVGASNIKIDLNGHTIKGSPNFSSRGDIEMRNRTSVAISNGKVESARYNRGIRIQRGHSNRIKDIVFSIQESGIGVDLFETSRNRVEDVTIQGKGMSGVLTIDSHKNTINRVSTEGTAPDWGIGIVTTHHERGVFTQGVSNFRDFVPFRPFLSSPDRGWLFLVSS